MAKYVYEKTEVKNVYEYMTKQTSLLQFLYGKVCLLKKNEVKKV